MLQSSCHQRLIVGVARDIWSMLSLLMDACDVDSMLVSTLFNH